MFYEFVHECKSDFINKLIRQANSTNFFIVCIGQLNYLYAPHTDSNERLMHFLSEHQIKLHGLPSEEMMSILDSPDTKQYQVFYGSKMMYNDFRQLLTTGQNNDN